MKIFNRRKELLQKIEKLESTLNQVNNYCLELREQLWLKENPAEFKKLQKVWIYHLQSKRKQAIIISSYINPGENLYHPVRRIYFLALDNIDQPVQREDHQIYLTE